jgi:hypothetical protein
MCKDWGTLPDKPSPLVVDNASKQLSIRRALLRAARAHLIGRPAQAAKITLYIPNNRPGHKRKTRNTVKPLRGSDAPGDKATIHHIIARSEPGRIKHGRRSTWVNEFLERWEQEECTFGEALEQYRLGFDIASITGKDDQVPSGLLQPFVTAKRIEMHNGAPYAGIRSLHYIMCISQPLRRDLSTSDQ